MLKQTNSFLSCKQQNKMTHQAVLGTTQVGRKNWQSHKWMDRSFDYASMQLAMAGIVRQTRRGSQGERRISPCVRGKSMDQVLTDCLSRLCDYNGLPFLQRCISFLNHCHFSSEEIKAFLNCIQHFFFFKK